jgi:hypothetical protein
LPAGGIEEKDAVVPDLRPARPQAALREIRAARDDEGAVGHTGERCRKPDQIRQRRQLGPAQGLGAPDHPDRHQQQQKPEQVAAVHGAAHQKSPSR